MIRPITAAILISAFVASTGTAEAKRSHRSGSCDGIHRCICGSTQARYFGLPRIVNGFNLWQAREWARAFPHTSIHAGAVGVKPHHVYRVIQPLGNGRAIVADERGQYERHVAGDVFVDPNGNTGTTLAAKSHRRQRMVTAASPVAGWPPRL